MLKLDREGEEFVFTNDSDILIPVEIERTPEKGLVLTVIPRLKKIGRGAFGGCGRLVSLTVPLTVTEIGEYAFNGCVSLEQLSLPPGVNVALEREMGSWDFGRYHGDNGKTDTRPEVPYDVYWDGILDSPEGAGMVTLYADSACLVPKGELPAGTQVRVTDLRSGICEIYTSEELYAPLASVQRLTGETLFSITTGRFAPGAVPLYSDLYSEEPDVSNPDDWKLESWFELSSEISFERTVKVWEDGACYTDTEYVTFAIQDTTLRRARTGDTRTLGLLVSADRSVSVQYADAPNAAPTGHVWSGEQAEVLEASDGWLRVRTARGTFWVAEADFRVVEQE